MKNENCKNIEDCSSCSSCSYCYSCSSCSSCYSCSSCSSCYSCSDCSSCSSCSYCSYCYSCSSCSSCSYCSYSKGLRQSEHMIFCLGEGSSSSEGEGYHKKYRVFNKDVSKEEYEKTLTALSDIKILPTKWIDKKDMSAEEKKEIKIASEIGGYLKTFTYKEAWQNFWNTATSEQKNAILNIPQFDAAIFKGITGIEITTELASEVITLNGVKYKKI